MNKRDAIEDKLRDLDDPAMAAYVRHRVAGKNKSQARDAAGIGRGKWYRLAQEFQDELEQMAAELRATNELDALELLQQESLTTVRRLIQLRDSKNESVAIRAVENIMDRLYGRAPASLDVTSNGERIVIDWGDDD